MVFTFPSDFASQDPNFTTLFRLLDDFDAYNREASGEESHPRRIQHGGGGRWGRKGRGLNPRFDIRETKNAYELYGEVPGADREDIHIELTEPNTLLIYGRVHRDYEEEEGGKKEDKGKEKAEGEGSTETGGKKGGKPKEDAPVRFFLRERQVGDFAREFSFPGPLAELDIDASLEKGILKVVAPKQLPSKGKKIEIK
ncbi:HSP20-like chaperone [Neurospora tetraspora]|uniref:HSP20-like chaperone n=1 Tax=Neurospora tetraspora TaxID=94610 RepID=A0AAE0MTC7_9PEZI|nr:HSP20-like chaperone [Neurospora tetraspora]